MSSTPEALPENDGSIAAASRAFESLLDGESPQTENDEEQTPVEAGESDSDVEEIENLDLDTDDDDESELVEEQQEVEEEEIIPTYTIKVDGQEIDVTLDELQKGYSRNADYTRKTQALSEERKQAQAEMAGAKNERLQYHQVLEQLKNQTLNGQGPEPDWDKLREEDPDTFAVRWADHQRRQSQIAGINAEQQRVQQIHQAEQEKELEATLTREKETLLEKLPDWNDGEVASKERRQITEWGLNNGYSQDQLNGIVNHVDILTLRKAMLFDQLQTKQKSRKPVVKKSAPTLKPGSANNVPRPRSQMEKASRRLKKSGSVRDAAAVFEQILDSS